jgi:predicted dehydrogenase
MVKSKHFRLKNAHRNKDKVRYAVVGLGYISQDATLPAFFNARKNSRGLEIQRVVYGFADKSAYYRIHFTAPKLYYFDTYYPEFEKTVASFKVTGKG